MPARRIWPVSIATTLLLLTAAGCHTAGQRFLSLVGLSRAPLALAVAIDRPEEAAQALNPFPTYTQLQGSLSEHLGRPIAVDVCFDFQAAQGLETGWYDFALLTPWQFAQLPPACPARVLAVSTDEHGRAARAAFLIVRSASDVQQLADLRGKVVAFGPANDARCHHAGLKLLESAGVNRSDLALELLPLPGSLNHLPDGRAIAQAVASGSAAAGFVDEAEWEGLPEHAASEHEPARDGLRVVGRTIAVPDRLVLASARLDASISRALRAFFLDVGRDHAGVLKPLAVHGFQEPSDELLAACRTLAAASSP